jgi:hypothetical protein
MALAGLSYLIGVQDRVQGRGPNPRRAVTVYTVGFRR